MRLLEKLNTPKAVVAVLAIFLVVDGFLLYRYRADDEAARPNNGEKGGALEARTAEPTEAPPSGAVSTAEAAAYSPVTAAAPTYREPISEPPQYGADLPASPQGATLYEWWFTY